MRFLVLHVFCSIAINPIVSYTNRNSNTDQMKIVPVTPPIQHGEGPHWDSKNGILYYVDTFQATAYRWDSKTKNVTSQKFDGRNSIGTITPIIDKNDQFIVSSDRCIYHLLWDGKESNTGTIKELFSIEEDKPDNQFNDGKADANGVLWIGTLTRQPDYGVTDNGGSLYQVALCAHPAHKQYAEVMCDTSISNGLCWTRDNKFMFYIDSSKRNIEKYEFDLKTETLGEKKVIFDLENYPAIEGILDGMTIDSENNLWVATFGGSSILKIHPCSGKLLKVVKMPVKYITSVAFGGKNYNVLYATTSRFHMSEDEVCQSKSSGAVFAITGLKVEGVPMFNVDYSAPDEKLSFGESGGDKKQCLG
ncbi:regucalcin-like isoform X2 [Sitophilus oryzae]|uniref:Regucalcin-like isoform X2 n=1 Tax=Sitophilus oryzae TaxID=7048 RepID=A0A6J2YMX0_SITOR|nr:regucalcin-like isoform X2 [Sitophilus oryzae]